MENTNMTDTVVGTLDRLVSVYVKIRDQKVELATEFATKEKELNIYLDTVKAELLAYCKDSGVESVKTTSGTFWRSQKSRFWTSDWEAMNKFIVDNEAVDLLEKRLHQGNMKQFLEENPDLHPPGLNADTEYTITVRRKK
jgi:hypothetical protein|tara:strand:+ start:592 stop:1011 length:420 start_codon:yes stop_codon:yes gene_type:complete